MARTPDRFPGRLIEDVEIFFDTPADSAPSGPGALTYDPTTQAFRLQDGVGVFNPHDLNRHSTKISVRSRTTWLSAMSKC